MDDRKPSFSEWIRRVGFAAAVVSLIGVATAVSPARALNITGTIVNGTTGARNVESDVTVIAPAKGMKPVATTRAVNGIFSFTDLDPNVPVYLVQVNFDGVPYRESVNPVKTGTSADVAMLVYQSTTKDDGIRLAMFDMAALRHDNVITVEKLFAINNVGSPGRTVTGDGAFRFHVPRDGTIRDLSVTGQGMPIKRTPVATDKPDVWRVDYPLRPGITQVDITFDVPYDTASYTLIGKFLYDVDEFSIFGADTSMTISAAHPRLTNAGKTHGMTEYTAKSVAAGTELNVTFSGGSEQTQVAAGHGNVLTVHNGMQNASIVVIVLVLLAMMAFMGMSLRGNPNPLDNPKNLKAYYHGLLQRLARLDDLHAAQAVDREAYTVRREQTKRQLAAIVYRLRSSEQASGRRKKKPNIKLHGKNQARA